jgi:hypothetical protein
MTFNRKIKGIRLSLEAVLFVLLLLMIILGCLFSGCGLPDVAANEPLETCPRCQYQF